MRIGLGMGLGTLRGGFRATQLSGCVLWLRADLGITAVDAAISNPSDLTGGGWAGVRISSVTVSTITDQTDGAPTTHLIQQTVPGLQTNHLASFVIGIPSASGGGRYVGVLPNAGGSYVVVDAQTGSITAQSGDIQGASYSAGVLSFSVLVTSALLAFYTMDGSGIGNITYTGASSRTVTLGPNGLGAYVTVTQRNVSAWADQSGSGNHATQGTASRQPLYVESAVNGHPALYFSGNAPADALTTEAFTRNQPHTALVCGFWTANPGANEYFIDGLSQNTAVLRKEPGANLFGGYAGTVLNGDATTINVPFVGAGVFNGASSLVALNGTETAGALGVRNASGVTIGADGGGTYAAPLYGYIAEVILYNRALAQAERRQVERYLGARYGITVA